MPTNREQLGRHLSSLTHQVAELNAKPKRPAALVIPPSNRGYRILRRIGWCDPAFDTEGSDKSPTIVVDDDTEVIQSAEVPTGGLGPKGHGRRNPVATTLKRDRLGLGWSNGALSKRVTHFGKNDFRAVQRVQCTPQLRRVHLDRRLPERRMRHDKAVERRIREHLSLTDEQFVALYGANLSQS